MQGTARCSGAPAGLTRAFLAISIGRLFFVSGAPPCPCYPSVTAERTVDQVSRRPPGLSVRRMSPETSCGDQRPPFPRLPSIFVVRFLRLSQRAFSAG